MKRCASHSVGLFFICVVSCLPRPHAESPDRRAAIFEVVEVVPAEVLQLTVNAFRQSIFANPVERSSGIASDGIVMITFVFGAEWEPSEITRTTESGMILNESAVFPGALLRLMPPWALVDCPMRRRQDTPKIMRCIEVDASHVARYRPN